MPLIARSLVENAPTNEPETSGHTPWEQAQRQQVPSLRTPRLWLPARTYATDGSIRQVYPTGAPIYRVDDDWHVGDVDGFWGPSVHWNTHLEKYVMLLNRAQDASWSQEGIYVAFASDLSEPTSWSTPQRLLAAGRWYPQVIGMEPAGTDREAGEFARFFMSGRSEYVIQFSK